MVEAMPSGVVALFNLPQMTTGRESPSSLSATNLQDKDIQND
jgi:hypothetical protein